MRGFLRCERCNWSRIYARFSVARLPQFCPACGQRVIRDYPTEQSPAVSYWRSIAHQLASDRPPGMEERPR